MPSRWYMRKQFGEISNLLDRLDSPFEPIRATGQSSLVAVSINAEMIADGQNLVILLINLSKLISRVMSSERTLLELSNETAVILQKVDILYALLGSGIGGRNEGFAVQKAESLFTLIRSARSVVGNMTDFFALALETILLNKGKKKGYSYDELKFLLCGPTLTDVPTGENVRF